MSVALSDVGHRFGDGPWLFRHVEAELVPGVVHGLTGPSGSGKSTLLALMAGWFSPVEGQIVGATHGRMAWVPQNPHGVARRSALDHVALPFLTQGLTPPQARAKALEVLEAFAIPELAERPFRALSGGEAQRLMLARAVAARPRLLLVDEPTAQLDRRSASQVDTVIGSLAREGSIVVVATHDPDTKNACDAVIDLVEFAQ